jgi:hypothetical protein
MAAWRTYLSSVEGEDRAVIARSRAIVAGCFELLKQTAKPDTFGYQTFKPFPKENDNSYFCARERGSSSTRSSAAVSIFRIVREHRPRSGIVFQIDQSGKCHDHDTYVARSGLLARSSGGNPRQSGIACVSEFAREVAEDRGRIRSTGHLRRAMAIARSRVRKRARPRIPPRRRNG